MYGSVFRDARKKRHVSIRALAEATGVSRRYLALIDKDDANISLKYLLRVASALGVHEMNLEAFRVTLDGRDVTGVVMAAVAEAIKQLTAVQDLLFSLPEKAPRKKKPGRDREGDNRLLAGILRTQENRDAAPLLAETPFAGRYVTPDTLPRPGEAPTLWSPDWSIPTEAFFPVGYACPEREDERYLRAMVLDDSMAPTLRQGDVVRIDTAIRAPHIGDLVAVHGMVSGSILGVLQKGDVPVLLRRNAPPVAIWRERFTVQGVVANAA
jgi:transcriptional regulator with XRE-family HTH domain